MTNEEYLELEKKLTLIAGVGDYSTNTACIMSAAVAKWRLSRNEPLGIATDKLECVCLVIRRFAIKLNDSNLFESNQHRTEILMPFLDKIIDTKSTRKVEQKRLWLCADYAVRKFAVIALRNRFPEHAKILETLPEIVDKATCLTAKEKSAYAADAAFAAAAYAKKELLSLTLELLTKMCEVK